MKLPPGVSEADLIESVRKATVMLAQSFVFGYYDVDDITQQAYLEVIKVMARDVYDSSKPLDNFVFTVVKSRLLNFKRDNWHRTDPPCRTCHAGEPHEDGEFCSKYLAWKLRNTTKKNLMALLPLTNSENHEAPSCVEADAETNDLRKLIDRYLSVGLRSTYLKMLSGDKVPRDHRKKVEAAVAVILRANGYLENESEKN